MGTRRWPRRRGGAKKEGQAGGAGPELGRRGWGRGLERRGGARARGACSVARPAPPRPPAPPPTRSWLAAGCRGAEQGQAGRAHGHGPVAAALLRLLHGQRLSQRLAAGRGRWWLQQSAGGRRHLWLEGKERTARFSPSPKARRARRAQVLVGVRARANLVALGSLGSGWDPCGSGPSSLLPQARVGQPPWG